MKDQVTQALQLLDSEDYQQALEILNKTEPCTPFIRALQGRALSGLHRWMEARDAFHRALDEDPDCHDAVAGIGLLSFLTGDLKTAHASFTRAIELAPTEGRYHGLRGLVFSRVGQPNEALAELENAYKLGDPDPAYLLARAQILISSNQPNEAEPLIALAEENGAKPSSALSLRGAICRGKGDNVGALALYKDALADEPDQLNLWWEYLGLLSHFDPENFESEVHRGMGFFPEDERLVVLAAAKYRENGLLDKAITLLKKTLEEDEDSIVLLEVLGDYLRDSGRHDESLATIEKALKLDPTSGRALFGRALVTSSKEEALDSFEKAVDTDPTNVVYQYHLGAVLSSLGQYKEALEPLDEAVKLDPTFWRAFQERSICFENLGKHSMADADRRRYEALRVRLKENSVSPGVTS